MAPRAPSSRRVFLLAGGGLILLIGFLVWTARGRLGGHHTTAATPVTPWIGDPTETRLREKIARQPRDAAPHAELGRYALSTSRAGTALWELEEARALGMSDLSLRIDHAGALAAAGQRLLAIAELRALLKDWPAEPRVRERLAALLLDTAQPAEAAALLKGGSKTGGDPAERILLLGRAYHGLGQTREAEAAFRQYARLSLTGEAPYQPLGRYLLATGPPEAARRVLMQDQHTAFRTAEFHYWLGQTYLRAQPADPGKAAAAFAVALHFDSHHARARAALGEAMERQRAREQAVSQYETTIQANPLLIEPHVRLAGLLRSTGQKVGAFQQQGIAATLQDQLPEALRAFSEMLRADPTDLDAIQSCILTSVAMKRVDRSRPAVAALQRLPFDPETAERVASLFLITGTRAPARALAEEWRRRQPKAAGPLRLLARLAVDDLRVQEGIKLYEQALAIDPRDAETASSLGLAWGRVPSRSNLEKAADWLGRAVQLSPGDARYHSELGEVDRQLGRLEPARDECLRALDLDASLTAAYNCAARVAQALGKPEQARVFAEIVRAGDGAAREEESLRRRTWDAPDDPQARLALSRFLLLHGQLERARYHLAAALVRRPNWEPALAIRRQVEALLTWS